MKKNLNFLIIACCLFALSTPQLAKGQIIADHSIVDDFDKIPQEYMDEVKKMWLVIAGESHSAAYRAGMEELYSLNDQFDANITESGTPEAYTDAHLRVSRGTWGDNNSASGWVYSYGEEDWFTGGQALERTKAGIAYCNSNDLTISAFGLGWCWDDNIDAADMDDYLRVTIEYMDYCTTNNIPTKILFTTGPVDGYSGEDAYNNYLRWQKIRDYVAEEPNALLFDYADILCWDDEGNETTETWDGHTFQNISPNSMEGGETGHIGMNGAVRIAKAMWWMLARIAGWEGTGTTSIADNNLVKDDMDFTCYPNPAKSMISFSYSISKTSNVSIEIVDLNGKVLNTIIRSNQAPGNYLLDYDLNDKDNAKLEPGTYLSVIKTNEGSWNRKFVVLKE